MERKKIDVHKQSVRIKDEFYASALTPDGTPMVAYYEDTRTLYEAFQQGLRASKNGPYLGTRSGPNLEYEWITYQQIYDRAHAFGSGLISKGLPSEKGTRIGVYSQNRPEWVIAAEACNIYSLVTVPLYDTLGPNACEYIINESEISTVIVDVPEKAQRLLEMTDKIPSLKRIIVINEISNNNIEVAQKCGVDVLSFKEIEDCGKAALLDPLVPDPDDVFSICYTSGTTGDPKGAILTHKNMIANVSGLLSYVLVPDHTDIHISYLPLAHMFERTVECFFTLCGARIGFFRGDVKLLLEDIVALKPTYFYTVPRLLNRIYDKIQAGVSGSWLKSTLMNMALRKKKALLERGVVTRDTFWDRMLLAKIQNVLGGRVRCICSASAPIAEPILEFVRAAFGCHVFEGYGQTECTAAISITVLEDFSTGSVGPPLPSVLLKLVDVPENECYVRDGKGEICVKGPCVMQGYLKQPKKTEEAIDSDGWLHTGDIGMMNKNGTLKIVDRKKHIFKLAQGEYVAPEKIELVYTRSSFVIQAFVDGSSLESYLVAIIVPDPEVLPVWAKKEGLTGSMEELCVNERVYQAILDDITSIGKTAGLKPFEQVKKIYLCPYMFSVENELLTPTFKSKRPALRKTFAKHIEDMYKQ